MIASEADSAVIRSIVDDLRNGRPVIEAPGGIDRDCRGMNMEVYRALRLAVFEASITMLPELDPRITKADVFTMKMLVEGVLWS